ncbi:MAG: hypothetical protein GY904_24200 [Planctomycetaceae bacterium]|nr:hypothetical protein [Planctomycetaceae bacterium]
MKVKRSIRTFIFVVSTFSMLVANVHAQGNSKGKDSRVVVGTLKGIDATGGKFDVLQSGEYLRKLQVNAKTVVQFVGLLSKGEQKPGVGMGVKATWEKDGSIKSIIFTPSVGEPAILGQERLNMTEQELFKATDKDASNSISYVEFSKYIYHSPKHFPDLFRKLDKDGDGVFDAAEFAAALSKVSWWQLSRRAPDEWFIQADENMNSMLDLKEFSLICTSGNHVENHFERADRDKSGSLTQRETATYIRSVTHGKAKSKKQRKRDEQVKTQSSD